MKTTETIMIILTAICFVIWVIVAVIDHIKLQRYLQFTKELKKLYEQLKKLKEE